MTFQMTKLNFTWSSVTSKMIFGFFLSKFFAWQALTDLKITLDTPHSTCTLKVQGNIQYYVHVIACYVWRATWVISQGASWPQTKYNLTNTFGYLNPFYTFGGVQIIPDKNIQIVKFIFRFSFFLFFLKKIFRLTKNSNFWKKSKKGKWKKKFFDCLFWTDDSPRSEFEVSFSLTLYNTLLFHLAVKISLK